MESRIQHFSHPQHPLILVNLKDTKIRGLIQKQIETNPNKVRYGNNYHKQMAGLIFSDFCSNEMLESAYSCISCNFHLHKLCAKLPTQMIHPHHDTEHPLTLVRSNYEFSLDGCFVCNICSEEKYAFSYHCSSCNFDVDVRCASEAQVMDHKGHRHPLRPFLSTALFKCHACAKEHSAGVSYKCNICPFWIHEECATLPTIIKYHGHVHPLSLVSPFPKYDRLVPCSICLLYFSGENHWYYECAGCDHHVHLNCLAAILSSGRSNTDESEVDDVDLTTLFPLPASFQYDDLVAQLIKRIITHNENGEKTVFDKVGPLYHDSHKHPLTLRNAQSSSELFHSGDKNKMKNDIICNACVLPISTPVFYSCTTCNSYFLHEWCGRVPNELQHPNHRQPLVLLGTGQGKYGYTNCSLCYCHSNGVFYRPRGATSSEIDIKCLYLPPAISHKAHQHPLKLKRDCSDKGCVACPRRSSARAYGCEKCCFYLHSSCALQPITITHRYDKHAFILIDAPIEDGPDEYVCEFCEEDIDPKWWFYHCLPCDLSACADCIFKKQGREGYFNPHLTYSSEIHNHPLAFVQVDQTKRIPLCSTCNERLCGVDYALHCAECNIMVHRKICVGKFAGLPIDLVLHEEPS